jgi:hypothetical protein
MDACSFCGKGAAECERLIIGGGGRRTGNSPQAAICDECVELCHRMMYGPHVALPEIPRDVLVSAETCPTEVTQEPDGLVVNCACAVEPSPDEESRRKELLAPFFPAGTRFRYFWPVEPPAESEAKEWLETVIDGSAEARDTVPE